MDKHTYKLKAKEHIDTIFAKIDELEALKEKTQGEIRSEFDQKLGELKSKKAEFKKIYEELETATEEKWHESKLAFSSASDSFLEGFSKIKSLIIK